MSAPAPEMSRGHGSERLSSREANLLHELAETINASLNMDAVLRRVTEATRELCRGDVARIALREPGVDVFVFRYQVGPELPSSQGHGPDRSRGRRRDRPRSYPGSDSEFYAIERAIASRGVPRRSSDPLMAWAPASQTEKRCSSASASSSSINAAAGPGERSNK